MDELIDLLIDRPVNCPLCLLQVKRNSSGAQDGRYFVDCGRVSPWPPAYLYGVLQRCQYPYLLELNTVYSDLLTGDIYWLGLYTGAVLFAERDDVIRSVWRANGLAGPRLRSRGE